VTITTSVAGSHIYAAAGIDLGLYNVDLNSLGSPGVYGFLEVDSGLHSLTVARCAFYGASGGEGISGTASTMTVSDTQFNIGASQIHAHDAPTLAVDRCAFSNGSGVTLTNTHGYIRNCTFFNNHVG